jgi:hypothetical protein
MIYTTTEKNLLYNTISPIITHYMSSNRHKKKPVTGQKKTYSTTDNFFGVVSLSETMLLVKHNEKVFSKLIIIFF